MSTKIPDKAGIYQQVCACIHAPDLTSIKQLICALAVQVAMTKPNSASLRNKLQDLISLTNMSSTLHF
jgi:hypothetical protein